MGNWERGDAERSRKRKRGIMGGRWNKTKPSKKNHLDSWDRWQVLQQRIKGNNTVSKSTSD